MEQEAIGSNQKQISFVSGDFDFYKHLVDEKREETLTLEFKRKANPSQVELQKDDKKLLGEVVSGFANASGGVLVLGVGTENVDGIDRASSISVIENVEAVASRYRAYIFDCTSPAVEGVEVHPIEDADGRGLVVVYVPKGQARPHMSRAPGHHTFYRRVMDRFLPMEAYEIEEMMRLKSAPTLDLASEIAQGGSIGGNRFFHLRFGLRNTSATMARFPYIEYHPQPDQPFIDRHGLEGNGAHLWPLVGGGAAAGSLFAGGADKVIHPGQCLYVFQMKLYERLDDRIAGWALSQLPSEGTSLHFLFGCEDHPRKAVEFLLTAERFKVIQ